MTAIDTALLRRHIGTRQNRLTDGGQHPEAFNYTVDGVTQTKTITRQVLQNPGTACQ